MLLYGTPSSFQRLRLRPCLADALEERLAWLHAEPTIRVTADGNRSSIRNSDPRYWTLAPQQGYNRVSWSPNTSSQSA